MERRFSLPGVEAKIANNEKSVTYPEVVYPGGEMADQVFAQLDQIRSKVDWSSLDEKAIFEFAGLFMTTIGTLHAYCDGNGRLAKTMAKYLIDTYTNYTVDRNRLLLRPQSTPLNVQLAISSLRLYPEPENMVSVFKKLQPGENKIIQLDSGYIQSSNFKKRFAQNLQTELEKVSREGQIPPDLVIAKNLKQIGETLKLLLIDSSD